MPNQADLSKIGHHPTLSSSVGYGCRNRAIDVAIVQRLLNAVTAKGSRAPLSANGIYDASVGDAIFEFQNKSLHLRTPDGRVAPHGRTITTLKSKLKPYTLPDIFSQAQNFSLWTSIDVARLIALHDQQFGHAASDKATGLPFVVQKLIDDSKVFDLRWAAYILGTIKHETAHTFMPIEEYKSSWSQHTGPGKYAAEISITNSAGQIVKNRYYGRGYIQLTWRDKYVALGKALGHGHEFEIDPTKVLEPETAYAIASLGMRDGLFRHGHTLFKYIHGNHRDYYNARYIINGDNQSTGLPDAADTIERYAIAFEALLLLSTQAT